MGRISRSIRVRFSRLATRATGINNLLNSRPGDAFPWHPHEMWMLYRDIRMRQPEVILEFGTGGTTIVMAEALRRNGHGHLYTVDAAAKWLAATASSLSEESKPFVTLRPSTLEVADHNGVPVHRYTDLPDLPRIDYMFVDGPDPADVPGGQFKKPISVDPVLLRDKFAPGARIIVEGRDKNVEFLRTAMGSKYTVKTDRDFRWTVIDKS